MSWFYDQYVKTGQIATVDWLNDILDFTEELKREELKREELFHPNQTKERMQQMMSNGKSNIYQITIESRFVLTQSQIKRALGIGYKILSVETEKDISTNKIINTDTAAMEIIKTGYRALARAFHPDLGGDENVMKILNKTKSELIELIRSL